MLARAMAEGKPVASDPIPLLRPNGPIGLVLAAPVLQEGDAAPAGFVTFSYELAPLMLANDDLSLFSVVLQDPRNAEQRIDRRRPGQRHLARGRQPKRPAPSMLRTVTFGGRDWSLGYYAKTNAAMRAQQTAAIVAAIGLALTGIVCGLFGYVAYNNLRLSREIQVRIGFERRLTAVIDELNHRVKNILAVIQSIVTRTLRHGADIDVARELLIGRIHAMSNVVSLLSESQWQGVKLKGLFEARAIPHADRIAISGPDIAVSARAAQSLSLLFFELASHSDEGLSLVGKHPHIVAHWEVTGEGPDAMFHFRWEEFNTSAATRRAGQRFRHDPARSRRAGGAGRHLEALLHRCQLCLRTHRADGDGGRHDRARPHRAIVGAGEAAARRIMRRICERPRRSFAAFATSEAIGLLVPTSAMIGGVLIAPQSADKKRGPAGPLFRYRRRCDVSRRCRRSRRGRCRRDRNPRRRRHRAGRSASSARG